MFGCGAVAQLKLSDGTHGIFLAVNLAFGFAATLGILVCGQVSGTPDYIHNKISRLCIFDVMRMLNDLAKMGKQQPVKTGRSYTIVNTPNDCVFYRRTSKSSCNFCCLPSWKRKMEKIPSVFPLPDNWRFSRGWDHLWHVLWQVSIKYSLLLKEKSRTWF